MHNKLNFITFNQLKKQYLKSLLCARLNIFKSDLCENVIPKEMPGFWVDACICSGYSMYTEWETTFLSPFTFILTKVAPPSHQCCYFSYLFPSCIFTVTSFPNYLAWKGEEHRTQKTKTYIISTKSDNLSCRVVSTILFSVKNNRISNVEFVSKQWAFYFLRHSC